MPPATITLSPLSPAQQSLVTNNIRLAYSVALRFRRLYPHTRHSREDIEQAAILGLAYAAGRYDPARGTRFSTCAVWWIRQFIQKEIAVVQVIRQRCDVARIKPLARIRSITKWEDTLPIDDDVSRIDDADSCSWAMRRLTQREKEVMHLRYGEEWSQADIGERLGISGERVRQILTSAKARLRGKRMAATGGKKR